MRAMTFYDTRYNTMKSNRFSHSPNNRRVLIIFNYTGPLLFRPGPVYTAYAICSVCILCSIGSVSTVCAVYAVFSTCCTCYTRYTRYACYVCFATPVRVSRTAVRSRSGRSELSCFYFAFTLLILLHADRYAVPSTFLNVRTRK